MICVVCGQSSNLMSMFIKVEKMTISGGFRSKPDKFCYMTQQVNTKFIMILVGAVRIVPVEFLIATLP